MISVCLYLYLWNSNLVLIYLCYCYCFVHQAWVPRNPPGNNPMPGLVCGWLCWELKILWKCHQPIFMYSLVSSLNKELTSSLQEMMWWKISLRGCITAHYQAQAGMHVRSWGGFLASACLPQALSQGPRPIKHPSIPSNNASKIDLINFI